MRDSSFDSIRRAAQEIQAQPYLKRLCADDRNLTKSTHPSLEGEDSRSLENQSKFWRKRKMRAGEAQPSDVIKLEQGEVDVVDFYEQSNFFIDTLKQDLCEPKGQGWFQFKVQVDQGALKEELPPVNVENLLQGEAGKLQQQEPQISKKTGRWANEEHQRFLHALKLYGKDWELIEKHIETRDLGNIRSHAQKFLVRLLKFIEGKITIDKMNLEEAQFYYGVLNVKVHKTTKRMKLKREIEEQKAREAQLKKEERERFPPPPKPSYQIFHVEKVLQPLSPQDEEMREEQSQFNRWKQSQASRWERSTYSVSSAVELVQQELPGGEVKVSFRQDLRFVEEDTNSVDSQDLIRFNVDTQNLGEAKHDPNIELQWQLRMKGAFSLLIDIDSDDEDPDMRFCLEDIGFEQNMVKRITSGSFMKVFHQLHLNNTGRNLPNLYKFAMKRINGHIEKENDASNEKPKPLMRMGPFTVQPSADVRVDLNRAREYFMRAPEQQVTRLAFKYFPKKAGQAPRVSADVQEAYIPVPMTKEDLKTLEDLNGYSLDKDQDSNTMEWTPNTLE